MGAPGSPFDSEDKPIEPRPVLPSGIEAGLLAGFVVIAVFLIHDMLAGESLHTPSVIGTLLIEGTAAAREVHQAPGAAAAYNIVHFALWIVVGSVGIHLMRRVERSAANWYLPWAALVVLIVIGFIVDSVVAKTGLGRLQLWLGGTAGTAAIAIFMAWRHPHAMGRVLRFGKG